MAHEQQVNTIGRVLFLVLKFKDAVPKGENDLKAIDKSITKMRR